MNTSTGHIGLAIQATQGVFVSPTHFTEYKSDDIGIETTPINQKSQVGLGRDLYESYPGPYHVTGGLEFDPHPNFLGTVLIGALGTDTPSTVTSGVYSHPITPADSIPYLSIQKKISNTFAVINYTDIKVNSLTLSCKAGELLGAKVDFVGISESGNSSAATPAYEIDNYFGWNNATVTLEGGVISPDEISLEIKNNLVSDDHRINSTIGRKLANITEGDREITATIKFKPTDWTEYRKANYGSASANTPGKSIYSGSLLINLKSNDVISGAYYYELTISIPKAYFQPYKVSVSGNEQIVSELNMLAVNNRTNPIITITLQNTVASYTS